MKKIIVSIILIICIIPVISRNTSQANITSDLIDKSVTTSNKTLSWKFSKNDHIDYVILRKKSIGVKKYRKITYQIYLRTRNSEGTEFQRAEGILKIRYRENYPSGFKFSRMDQLGFKLYPMDENQLKLYDQMDKFWHNIQQLVDMNDKYSIAEMLYYPFESKYFGSYQTKEDFLKNFENIFTDDVKESVANSIIIPSFKSKGKEFDFDEDDYIQKCDFRYQIKREGSINYFVVRKINNNFKLVSIKDVIE